MNKKIELLKDKKAQLQRIKNKYDDLSMSDELALKIKKYDDVNNVFKIAATVVGVVGVVDIFIPDPLFGLDEAALLAISGLFGKASSICSKKIEKILDEDDASLKLDDLNNISTEINDVFSTVNTSRNARVRK